MLGVVEEKANINDIGAAFARFQSTVGWLCGEAAAHQAVADAIAAGEPMAEAEDAYMYDPREYVTKSHPQGHFVHGVHSQALPDQPTKARRFSFAPRSFRLFRRRLPSSSDTQVYLDRVHFITKHGILTDLSSKERGKLTSRLAECDAVEIVRAPRSARMLPMSADAADSTAVVAGSGDCLWSVKVHPAHWGAQPQARARQTLRRYHFRDIIVAAAILNWLIFTYGFSKKKWRA